MLFEINKSIVLVSNVENQSSQIFVLRGNIEIRFIYKCSLIDHLVVFSSFSNSCETKIAFTIARLSIIIK